MASFVVDGLTLPLSVAGHPALDFCNTRAGWRSSTPKEYLRSHAHLAVWARENQVIPAAAIPTLHEAAAREPDAAAATVARALAFRSALYAVLVGPDPSPADWAAVNLEVRAAAAGSVLVATIPASWTLVDQSHVDYPLRAVAWSAATLLTSPAAGQVGACPGDGCGWLFVDPRGRRRWCSMAWCGNRNKARRYANRTRPPGS